MWTRWYAIENAHWKPGTHTDCRNFQNINKWEKHLRTTISLSRTRVRWVAFARGVAQAWHVMSVDYVQCVCINCNTPSSVRCSSPCAPPGTQKVSWSPAQINVPSVPAGVVSGSPGRRGTGPSLSDGSCWLVQYLKRVVITSVIRVLTGLCSCLKAMHTGNAWRRNCWAWVDVLYARKC